MIRFKELALIAALLGLSAAPRLPGIGRFTSIDEPFWLRQSANFYYALGQREFQNTLYEYHPAVTTMWIISAGMLAYFPEYRALGQGYLKPGKVDLFLLEHGKEPLGLLITSRLVQVACVLILLVGVYLLLRHEFGPRSAFFATSLISLSPFLVGQSRLLNHESLVGLFSLVSLLGLFGYVYGGRKFLLLAVSGAAAGLAQVTKSSGVPILPVALLMLSVDGLTSGTAATGHRILGVLKTYGLWLLIAAATYFAVWPGMWVAPGTMLKDVYGNAVSYALLGARTSVSPVAQAGGFDVAALAGGIGIYLNDLLWRTTPVTALGAVIGVGLAIGDLRKQVDRRFFWLTFYALLLAAAFVALFGVQRGPKPPHYLLTSYVCLDLVAGLGFVRAWDLLSRRWPRMASCAMAGSGVALILALQLASALASFPYYISYYNPVIEALQPGIQNPTLDENGYGMGLDQAAAYLAEKPGAARFSVLSAHGLGSFSYYFPGTTVAMNDLDMSDPLIASIVRSSDYVVVDYLNQTRRNTAQDLEGVTPEKGIWLNHYEFLRIYRASDLLRPAP